MKRISDKMIVEKTCSDCGKIIKVDIKDNGKYSGGNYFGPLPGKYSKTEDWVCNDCWKD
jgi:hypothetical protein